MYCRCHSPKVKRNMAYNKSFEVCSSQLGGCGKEIHPEPWKQGPVPEEQMEDGRAYPYAGVDMALPVHPRSAAARAKPNRSRVMPTWPMVPSPSVKYIRLPHPAHIPGIGAGGSDYDAKEFFLGRRYFKTLRVEADDKMTDLLNFMQDRGVLYQFFSELAHQQRSSLNTFSATIRHVKLSKLDAIDWAGSQQGAHFWSAVWQDASSEGVLR